MSQAKANDGPNGTQRTPQANIAPRKNEAVPNYHSFIPLQPQPIGSLLPSETFPQNAAPPALFKPLTIRGVEFVNRLWVSPMCQYSSDDGKATDHHFVHLGSMAFRGWGNVMVEASSVVPEGRITPQDSGIWSDAHIDGFKRVVDYVHAVRGKIGIQLAHAGRKASTQAPWVHRIETAEGWKGGETASVENGGWPDETYGPSAISFDDKSYPYPQEASIEYITDLKQKFLDAVERCKTIGFDFIELHGAHGYLFHEFASPLSNQRTDKYGGSLENRLRFPLEISEAVRKAWDGPLFYRVSASDETERVTGPEKAHPGEKEEFSSWGIEQTTILAQRLEELGVDLIDVSSGGNDPRQHFNVKQGYQVPYAEHIKKHTKSILVGAVGVIVEAHQANEIVEKGQADVVFMAREILRNIDFPLKAAEILGPAVHPAVQYERAWGHMVVKREACGKEKKHEGLSEEQGQEGRDNRHTGERGVVSGQK